MNESRSGLDAITQLDTFITHTFPMRQIQEAWALQCTNGCGKVVLDAWA